MKVIVPCAGSSSRYPNVPPKWTLPSPDGRPMVVRAVEQLDFDLSDIVITILQEHEQRYDAVVGLQRAFGRKIEIVVLKEQTASQPATVAETLRNTGLDEPFLVKDSDNCFKLSELNQAYNYVSVASLNEFDQINPRNKSYVQVDENDVLTAIREKTVISDLFSVGGYFFRSPKEYLSMFERLQAERTKWQHELYISDVIGGLILQGSPFRARRVTNYEDWGTIQEWRRALLRRGAYFIQLDGFVFERGSEFFAPRFADVRANPEAVRAVRHLVRDGHKIVFVSIRPSSCREVTERQLAALDLPTGHIVFDCPIARYWMVTSPHPTVPFTTSRARELDGADPNLEEKLRHDD